MCLFVFFSSIFLTFFSLNYFVVTFVFRIGRTRGEHDVAFWCRKLKDGWHSPLAERDEVIISLLLVQLWWARAWASIKRLLCACLSIWNAGSSKSATSMRQRVYHVFSSLFLFFSFCFCLCVWFFVLEITKC